MPSLAGCKEIVANSVDNPEVFVAGSDFQNLLRAGQLNERGVAHLRAHTHDVVGVVFDDAGGLLAVSTVAARPSTERNDG